MEPLADESLPTMLQTGAQNNLLIETLASSPQVPDNQNLGSLEISESDDCNFFFQRKLLSLLLPKNQSTEFSESNHSDFLSNQPPLLSLHLPDNPYLGTPKNFKSNNSNLSSQRLVPSLPENQPLSSVGISNPNSSNFLFPKTQVSIQSTECLPFDSIGISDVESDDFVLQRKHFDEILDFCSKVYKICKCEECEVSFNSFEELEEHWEKYEEYKCGFGDKPLRTRSYWQKYFQSNNTKTLGSIQEPNVPNQKDAPIKQVTPRNRGKAICHICGKILCDGSSLTNHLRIHTGEKPYACHLCNKTFSFSSSLYGHIRGHSSIKTHFCDVCNKGFVSKANVRIHMRTHTGEKNFKCDVCNGTFTQNSQLTEHKRQHSDDRPYQCHLCPSNFKRKTSLDDHLLTHGKERPFKCDLCDSSFKSKYKLKRHKYIHSEVKPHQCFTCGKGFSQKVLLRRHFKIHPEVKL